MKKPKAVYLYLDNFKHLKKMSAEDIGRLMIALMDYAEDGSLPDFSENMTLDVLFGMMSEQIDRDFEKYAQTCETRSKAAKTAAQARWNKKKDKCETHTNAQNGCVRCQKEDDEEYEEDQEYENEYEYEKEYDEDALSADVSRASSDDVISVIPYNASDSADLTENELYQLNDVVAYLNLFAGTDYKTENFSAKQLIIDRLREGHNNYEMKLVIESKYNKLLEMGFGRHNIPCNMFGACFDKYLAQAFKGE